MKQYLEIVNNVLTYGQWKKNRTGTRTLTTFCEIFRHNMSDGFPLLTSKKMAFKSIAIELEGFIKGITDKNWFQERGCRIWNEWANPAKIENKILANAAFCNSKFKDSLRKDLQKEEDDLGPIYGYQWRSFNKNYGPEEKAGYIQYDKDLNWYVPMGSEIGTDQLKKAVKTLKTNPDDRRMVISAWNPNQIHMMALPPCHYAFTLVHINGVLNLCWKQRSCDLMLGIPFNISSYGLLLELLCKESGLKPGQLVGILEDCHIYENHIDKAKQQLNCKLHKLPKLKLKDPFNIFEWTYKDFEVLDYISNEKIDFGKVAV